MLGSARPDGRAVVRIVLLVTVAVVWGWTAGDDPADDPDDDRPGGPAVDDADGEPESLRPRLADLPDATTVVDADGAAAQAVASSSLFFETAPVAVLAAENDVPSQARAADAATDLGMPMLYAPAAPESTGDAVRDELARLAPEAVLVFGSSAEDWARQQTEAATVVAASTGEALPTDQPDATVARETDPPSRPALDDLPPVAPGDPVDEVLVLVEAGGEDGVSGAQQTNLAAAATAEAAGARLVPVAGADPRADTAAIAALSGAPRPERVVAIGAGFGPAERLRRRVEVAATGVELPGGGQVLFPDRRMVALYGHPTTPAMGVLGEQAAGEAVARAESMAAEYEGVVAEPVVPAFEMITTVATSSPGPDGDYSNESEIADLRPWVDAAGRAGMYVVLDLQPGRADFLTQARRYEELLAETHVGLALDPEWRLGPGQVHSDQVGTVTAAEVNEVAGWLARLTRERRLPQKLLVIHQFQTRMISDRGAVATDHDELAVLIHADGFGTPRDKLETWAKLRAEPLPGAWWGWKNFVDEDTPTFAPPDTMALDPVPRFISYQ